MISNTPEEGLIGEGAYKIGGLNKLFENFEWKNKYLLLGNREKYQICLCTHHKLTAEQTKLKYCVVAVDI